MATKIRLYMVGSCQVVVGAGNLHRAAPFRSTTRHQNMLDMSTSGEHLNEPPWRRGGGASVDCRHSIPKTVLQTSHSHLGPCVAELWLSVPCVCQLQLYTSPRRDWTIPMQCTANSDVSFPQANEGTCCQPHGGESALVLSRTGVLGIPYPNGIQQACGKDLPWRISGGERLHMSRPLAAMGTLLETKHPIGMFPRAID